MIASAGTPELKAAQERARKAGLRSYRVDSGDPNVDAYRVRCTSGKCEAAEHWHTVGIWPLFEACDCEHGRKASRGVCLHIGQVTRRRDFRRPPLQEYKSKATTAAYDAVACMDF